MSSGLFKNFSVDENVSTQSKVKSSVLRGILRCIEEQYPIFAAGMEELLPKKRMNVAKCQGHLNIILKEKTPVFFNVRDGPYFPTLRMLHMYPDMLPRMQIDKGGIRFIMNGADVMCPGLTSAGGQMCDAKPGDVVGIFAEGKECAMAVGIMKMTTEQILEVNKGVAIETVHVLNDNFWKLSPSSWA